MNNLAPGLSTAVLQALPQPVIVVDEDRTLIFVNYAAETFFGASLSVLSRQRLDDIIAFGSPIVGLAQSVAERRAPMTEYRVRVGSARFGDAADDRIVDVFASPISDSDARVALPADEAGRQPPGVRPRLRWPRRHRRRHLPEPHPGAVAPRRAAGPCARRHPHALRLDLVPQGAFAGGSWVHGVQLVQPGSGFKRVPGFRVQRGSRVQGSI